MVRARNPNTNGQGKGGPRAPTPGTQYTNRADLQQTPTAMPGQAYGQAGAQLAAQKAMPLPSQPGPPTPGPPGPQAPPGMGVPAIAQGGGPSPPQPGHFGPLDRMTERPNESLHTGSPSGPGAGPEVLPVGSADDHLVNQVRALYQMFPIEEFRDMLSRATGGPQ